MRRLAILAAALVGLAAPAGAQQYLAVNGHWVYPTGANGVMQVRAQPGSAGSQFFCAAADYARVRLGAVPTDRLVLLRPVERLERFQGRRAATIGLVPQGTPLPRGGLILSTRHPGENVNVGTGLAVCRSDRR